MNILVALDGVLSSDTGEPIRSGVMLYYALNINNRVALVTSRTREDAEQWLYSHGIINYDDLIDASYGLAGEDMQRRQFITSRSHAPVEFYVGNDPAMCAWVFEKQGVPVMLVADPNYQPVEKRPDAPKKVRAWTDIEDAVTRVNVARSQMASAPKDVDLWQD